MFPYANESTPFKNDLSRELLQTAGILNIRECISSNIPVFQWNQIEIVLQFIIYEDIHMIFVTIYENLGVRLDALVQRL